MQSNDALNAVLPVIEAFERLGVPYYVGVLLPVPRMASCGPRLTRIWLPI